MTDKQPEALRLANEYYDDHWIVGTKTWCRETANELRRLHTSEREGWRYADEVEQERKRLHEVNAELVEALKAALSDDQPYIEKCKAALAKAQGDNNGQR